MGDEGRKAYSDFCLKPALLQGSRRWVTGGPDLAPLQLHCWLHWKQGLSQKAVT